GSASSGRPSGPSATGTRRSRRTRVLPEREEEASMADKADVLVVANRTAGSPELLEALKERAARGPAKFHLLVPSTPHGVAWAADIPHRVERATGKPVTHVTASETKVEA